MVKLELDLGKRERISEERFPRRCEHTAPLRVSPEVPRFKPSLCYVLAAYLEALFNLSTRRFPCL